ncbi:hypothetical protein HIM_06573 [Hirsutella minnesotensis 3608]|uniref:Uncharacterized protein n=1 Tax=Hirsutella minnesotensis 3608 TaxID=1043627 RepID=A0A0F8A4T2_9HYPO|nr:hypothetical protein HIM_06573 [Hirsutella minnesotensis 3608]
MKAFIAVATLFAGLGSARVLQVDEMARSPPGPYPPPHQYGGDHQYGGGDHQYGGGEHQYGGKHPKCGPNERLESNAFNPSGPKVCIPEGAVQ